MPLKPCHSLKKPPVPRKHLLRVFQPPSPRHAKRQTHAINGELIASRPNRLEHTLVMWRSALLFRHSLAALSVYASFPQIRPTINCNTHITYLFTLVVGTFLIDLGPNRRAISVTVPLPPTGDVISGFSRWVIDRSNLFRLSQSFF